jgi:hypothetical protein
MYTIHIFHTLSYKNKLHEDLHEFFKQIEHAVFSDLQELKDFISSKVAHLNVEHKRCTPFKISFTHFEGDNLTRIDGIYTLGVVQILHLREFKPS